nr:MAG TPA: hypothetical protein [Caudoviricetes sp.]
MTPKMLSCLMLFMIATAFKYASEVIKGFAIDKHKLTNSEVFYRVWIIAIVLMFALHYARAFSHLG